MEPNNKLIYYLILGAVFIILIALGASLVKLNKKNLTTGLEADASIKLDKAITGAQKKEKNVPENNSQTQQEMQQLFATIKTNLGDIQLELFLKDAPVAVQSFVSLAQSGFYNGTKFHRVIKDFMIQGGDPNSKDNNWEDDGMGGPNYSFKDEINSHKLVRGTLAMANAGPDTNGSQFFIVTAESTPWLDGKHTVFGQVIQGMDVVSKIENVPTDPSRNDHPKQDVIVESIEITSR